MSHLINIHVTVTLIAMMVAIGDGTVEADHPELGRFRCQVDPPPHWLFCDNETNPERVHGLAGVQGHFKDAFHAIVVHGRDEAVNPGGTGKGCGVLPAHGPAR